MGKQNILNQSRTTFALLQSNPVLSPHITNISQFVSMNNKTLKVGKMKTPKEIPRLLMLTKGKLTSYAQINQQLSPPQSWITWDLK